MFITFASAVMSASSMICGAVTGVESRSDRSVLNVISGLLPLHNNKGERGLVVGRWTCNPAVLCSDPPPCQYLDFSSVAPNSNPTRFVNSQHVCLLPVGDF